MPDANIDIDVKEVVKEKYGQAALRVTNKAGGSSCCGSAPAREFCDPITANLYDASQAQQIPEEALLASRGCGNVPGVPLPGQEAGGGLLADGDPGVHGGLE